MKIQGKVGRRLFYEPYNIATSSAHIVQQVADWGYP
jgi:hypothetical protein